VVLLCTVRVVRNPPLTPERVHPHSIQWEDYKAWRSRTAAAWIEKDKQATERIATLDYRPAAAFDNDVDQPLSFARLCELISQGRTNEIPGIKEIPEDLNVCFQGRARLIFRTRRLRSQLCKLELSLGSSKVSGYKLDAMM
jgi:hypothetical protein